MLITLKFTAAFVKSIGYWCLHQQQWTTHRTLQMPIWINPGTLALYLSGKPSSASISFVWPTPPSCSFCALGSFSQLVLQLSAPCPGRPSGGCQTAPASWGCRCSARRWGQSQPPPGSHCSWCSSPAPGGSSRTRPGEARRPSSCSHCRCRWKPGWPSGSNSSW